MANFLLRKPTGGSFARGADLMRLGATLVAFPTKPPLPADPDYVAGTTNLVANPSAELDLYQIFAINAAVATRSTSDPWDGVACVEVATPGSVANEGLSWRTLNGLALSGLVRPFVAQIRLKGAGVALDNVHLRLYYADATTDDGPSVSLALTDDWKAYTLEPAWTDGAKTLDHVGIEVKHATAQTATYQADGAQIEEAEEATPFAIGSYGAPYHRWQGTAHRSPTYRDPIPLTLPTGYGGVVRVTPKLFRADVNNAHYEDISDAIISGAVTMNVDRAIKWDFDCRLTSAGYDQLRPFRDYLAPHLRVDFPDGTTRMDQLGLYVVRPSPEDHTQTGKTVSVDGADLTWLLSAQGFARQYVVKKGENLINAARDVVADAGLARTYVPSSPRTAPEDMTWDTETDKLSIVNDLLEAAGYYTLYANSRGVIHSTPYRDLHRTQPRKTIAANRAGDAGSEVVGVVRLEPETDKFRNRFVILQGHPKRAHWRVVRTLSWPLNPMGVDALGRTQTFKYKRAFFYDVNVGNELARRLAEEYSTLYYRVKMTILPDPTLDVHDTLRLAVYNQDVDPVAVGTYWLREFKVGFTPRDAVMTLGLGKTQDILD